MTDVELIYVSYAPEVEAWLADVSIRQRQSQETIAAFEARVNEVFGGIDGRARQLRVNQGLIIGVETAGEFEAVPDGWLYHAESDSHMPDADTAAGLEWQRVIDALPPLIAEEDTGVVGMPEKVILSADDEVVGEVRPLFRAALEGGVTFATWPMRAVKPAIDAQIAKLGTGYWTEMPRSAWFARVEHYEAIAEAQATAAAVAAIPPAP